MQVGSVLDAKTIQHKFRNFSKKREFVYDDYLLAPARMTDFLEQDIDFSALCTKGLHLKIPLVSSPMDSVTEADLAIAVALAGGIGVLHYNYPSLDAQVADAKRVKSFENGFILNPITLNPYALVDEAAIIRSQRGISTIPIVDDQRTLLGVLTKDDYSMKKHKGQSVTARMIPFEQLVVAQWSALQSRADPLDAANDELLESHKSMLPVIDANRRLVALVTRSDIEKNENYPLATKDSSKRLRVLAAIEAFPEKGLLRAEALSDTVDGFVIDTAHGYTKGAGLLLEELKKKYAGKFVIAGNISTKEATEYLIGKGADAIKVGTGPGMICTTNEVTGTGRPQGSAVWECVVTALQLRNQYGHVPVIADGGISGGGDITKALALGADTVMCGNLFAATKETPGPVYENEHGQKVKRYRGMGSMEAMQQGSAVRYAGTTALSRVPEGVPKDIPYKGDLIPWIERVKQAMRQGFYKTGCRTIEELHNYSVVVSAPPKKKE